MRRFIFFLIPVAMAAGMIVTSCLKHNITPVNPTNAVVTTLAGGSTGYTGGLITGAFSEPTGVAIDAAGNVYVADAGNNLIQKISPLGVVTTLAGNGQNGSANGTGTAASFNNPTGVAVDIAGNVYVADADNSMVRKISPSGVVTTIAGNGGGGSNNGPITSATFNTPVGVAVDAAGNVYVADTQNNLIRKISPSGVVTTLAGSGARGSVNDDLGIEASFSGPTGVAVDKAGNVYVADAGNNLIRLITPFVATLAGNGAVGSADGKGSDASFNNPQGVAVDAAGNVYVADMGNNLIRKITQ